MQQRQLKVGALYAGGLHEERGRGERLRDPDEVTVLRYDGAWRSQQVLDRRADHDEETLQKQADALGAELEAVGVPACVSVKRKPGSRTEHDRGD